VREQEHDQHYSKRNGTPQESGGAGSRVVILDVLRLLPGPVLRFVFVGFHDGHLPEKPLNLIPHI
jgi:hypothetical protein